jgi:transglutaminase-like putative cysteine protease
MPTDRRDVLKGGTGFVLAAMLPASVRAAPARAPALNPISWRSFELKTQIEIRRGLGRITAWVPLPSISAEWIRPLGDDWKVENGATADIVYATAYDVRMLRVEWPEGIRPVAKIRSRIATRDRGVDLSSRGAAGPLGETERALYLGPTALIPTDGIVKETAEKIVGGAGNDVGKARLIYEWIVANTFRDPKVPGCGSGDVAFMLRTGRLGGKCADLNALLVGLARASGIPARDLYGIRVAPSRLGYKSLGTDTPTITKAQHCRAEVYLSGFGWVPMDPADVRKVALEEPPGNLAITDPKVAGARQTLFGAWEGNWIAYNDAHDVELPGAHGPRVNFLMYPQAETAAGRIDCLDASAFHYAIESRELLS